MNFPYLSSEIDELNINIIGVKPVVNKGGIFVVDCRLLGSPADFEIVQILHSLHFDSSLFSIVK